MITLHGFSFSNYYNIVKHVLLYKGLDFTEDENFGGTDEYLKLSPVGKIPSMTTAGGQHLSESSVCCDYLEEVYPEPALYPADAYERNRVRQIMKISELYLELASRRLIAFAFSNTEPPDKLKEEVRGIIQRGVDGMNRTCSFSPYIAGDTMTMADIYVRYVMAVVEMAGSAKLDWDIAGDIEGMKEWQAMMADMEISKKVDADMKANAEPFFAMLKERFGM